MSKLTLAGGVGGTRGRVSRMDGTYTRMVRQTGRSYAIARRKRVTEWSEKQRLHRLEFSMVTKALSGWIRDNKSRGTAVYGRLMRAFRRQDSCYTLRGYMMRRGMACVDVEKGLVTVTVYGEVTEMYL